MQPGHTSNLFRERDFLLYVGNRFAASMGQSLQLTALTWQVYDTTGSALQIAFLGVARFIPSFVMSLVGGVVADTRDRRLILGLSQAFLFLTTLSLLIMTAQDAFNTGLVYALVAVQGLIGSFENPARQSVLPQLVPPELFQRAVPAATTVQQLAMVGGPMVAGVVIATFGIAQAYGVHLGLILVAVAFIALVNIPYGTVPRGTVSMEMVKDGLKFVRDKKAVLGAMILDLFAVVFAGATALLPIYAKDILVVGPVGLGVLTASIAIGSFGMATLLIFLPPIQAAGRAMVLTVFGFCVATIAFGLSTNFVLSCVLYGLVGATDQISVVMRTVVIQLGTPDALRGRVSAVHFVFVGASNQLAQVRAGLVADLSNAVFSVVSGGIMAIILSAMIVKIIPELWGYRTGQPQAEEAEAAGST